MTRTTKNMTRLAIENLENRDCLSATLLNGTLTITGTSAADHILVVQDDAINDIQVMQGTSNLHFDSSLVNKISVDLMDGNDTFDYRLGGEMPSFTRMKTVNVLLGLGDDRATIDMTNPGLGDQPATMTANLKVLVNGNLGTTVMDGKDKLQVMLGHLNNADVVVKANLGNDNDISDINLTGDLIGDSDVKLNLLWNDGANATQDGDDFFIIHADNDVDIDYAASLNLNVGGGRGQDGIRFQYHGMVDGLLKAQLDGGKEHDSVEATVLLDAGSEGSVDIKVLGMGGDDGVGLMLQDNSNGQATILNSLVDGGEGFDRVSFAVNATVVNTEGVFGPRG